MSTRRRLVFLALTPLFPAHAQSEPAAFLALLAADLSAENAAGFLNRLSPDLPGYRDLVPEIEGLTKIADLQSSLEILELKQEGNTATATIDWYLEIRPHPTATDDQRFTAIRRREFVKCSLERWKKSWRVVRLEPLSFFAAPELKR